jgi:hypothetical protein
MAMHSGNRRITKNWKEEEAVSAGIGRNEILRAANIF